MNSKVKKYKVWVHIEGLNKDSDCIEGDDYHEPREAGCVTSLAKAEQLRDELLVMAHEKLAVRRFDSDGRAICPHCGKVTSGPYSGLSKLPCWNCSKMFPPLAPAPDRPWILCLNRLPPDGMPVETKFRDALGCRIVTPLVHNGGLWFFLDHQAVNISYQPTHWRELAD